MRKITVGRGLVEAAGGARGRAEGVAYRIDGELWTHVGTLGLWLRLPPGKTVPSSHIHAPEPAAARFVRRVATGSRSGALLTVDRREGRSTVGGVPLPRHMLDGLEVDHGAVGWRLLPRERWLVAYAGRRVVAIVAIHDDYHLTETRMVLHEGDVWMTDGHFACLLSEKVAGADRARIMKLAERDAGFSAGLVTMLAAGEGAEAVPAIVDGEVVRIGNVGELVVPHHQVVTIQANVGRAVTWHPTGPRTAIVGKVGGRAVALVMPNLPPEAGEVAITASVGEA